MAGAGGYLFRDADWREAALERARKIYPNQGMHKIAEFASQSHPYAVQYLEQAPALLAFVLAGHLGNRTMPNSRAARLYIAEKVGAIAGQGPRLKEFLGTFSAPLQIRQISAVAVFPSNFGAIRALWLLSPSDLAQAIPVTAGAQRAWLAALRVVIQQKEYFQSAPGFDFAALVRWSAAAFSREIADGRSPASHVRNLLDYIRDNPARFHPKLSMTGALRDMEQWHVSLAKKQDEERFLSQHGVHFDQEVDYAPWPAVSETQGFTLTALCSGRALWMEGAAMRHCVATYVRQVILNGTRIYSVQKDGRRLATLQLNMAVKDGEEVWTLVQLAGPCNSVPAKGVRQLADLFVERETKRIKAERLAEANKPKDMAFWTGGIQG